MARACTKPELKWRKNAPSWCVPAKTPCRSTRTRFRAAVAAPRSKTASQLCRAEIERFRDGRRERRRRSPSAARRRRRCSPKSPASDAGAIVLRQYARNRRLVEGRRRGRAEDGGAARGRRRAACPKFPMSASKRRRRAHLWPRRARHRGRQAAVGSSRRHRADRAPTGLTPPRVTEFPVVQGTIRSAKGHLGAFETDGRRLCRAAPSSRGELALRRAAQWRGVALRSPDRSVRRRAVVSRRRSARRLFARRSRRSRPPCCAPCSRRAISIGTFDKPRYITFTEDLCAHSRSQIVGCHRCLDLCPDRRDRAERRSCRDRCANLRRLRPMRRRLSDRRCGLCAAAGRRADAQASRAARRPIARPAAITRSSCCMTRPTAPS